MQENTWFDSKSFRSCLALIPIIQISTRKRSCIAFFRKQQDWNVYREKEWEDHRLWSLSIFILQTLIISICLLDQSTRGYHHLLLITEMHVFPQEICPQHFPPCAITYYFVVQKTVYILDHCFQRKPLLASVTDKNVVTSIILLSSWDSCLHLSVYEHFPL